MTDAVAVQRQTLSILEVWHKGPLGLQQQETYRPMLIGNKLVEVAEDVCEG